ncbi:MAG: DUF2723 domain-containing protein [Anaerolineae bacterium]|nr:MAG: DUF2723 domain-containing protein [Anaerolineae bacterium]
MSAWNSPTPDSRDYLLLAGILAAAYGFTLAPAYTWANRAADAGDLITAAYTGGVPHPTGYPTYLLLARLFQYLPFGTLALRTNLLSAVCALLAALLVMSLARRLSEGDPAMRRWAGWIAGLSFGLSPLLWSQAVITEVYTLHVLFVAAILWLSTAPSAFRHGSKTGRLTFSRREPLVGLLFGLGLGNHVTLALLLPVWLFAPVRQRDWHALGRRISWVLAGASIYLTLPLRARGSSPVNWGGADTWRGFWWLVSGALYRGKLFAVAGRELLARLGVLVEMVQEQFGWVGLALMALGVLHWRKRVWNRWAAWIAAICSLFALFYAVEDWYLLTLPVWLVLAPAVGAGAAAALRFAARRGRMGQIGVAVLILLSLAWHAARVYPAVNAREDDRAVRFAAIVLSRSPQNALLLTQEDADTFALWYYHFALGHRPDLILLHGGLLAYDWYRQRMQAHYAGLVLPATWDCFQCAYREVLRLNRRPLCQTRPQADDPLLCW